MTEIGRALALVAAVWLVAGTPLQGQARPPALTSPVNDFAGVVDAASSQALERLIRSLQRASGDVIVVATVETVAPYADIREYAVELFENRGAGIGQRAEDNGLLVLVAVEDRQVWIEVGYGLEPIVTDGFAGETARQVMAPAFARGEYGPGLVAGVARLAGRIAEARNVTLEDVPAPAPVSTGRPDVSVDLVAYLLFLLLAGGASFFGRRGRRRHYAWGMGPWSGWNSGVGSFGGGRFGGGFGGFGGFGGGRSGGGGGGAGW